MAEELAFIQKMRRDVGVILYPLATWLVGTSEAVERIGNGMFPVVLLVVGGAWWWLEYPRVVRWIAELRPSRTSLLATLDGVDKEPEPSKKAPFAKLAAVCLFWLAVATLAGYRFRHTEVTTLADTLKSAQERIRALEKQPGGVEAEQLRKDRGDALAEARDWQRKFEGSDIARQSAEHKLSVATAQLDDKEHRAELRDELAGFAVKAYRLRQRASTKGIPPPASDFIVLHEKVLRFARENLEPGQLARLETPRVGVPQWFTIGETNIHKAIIADLRGLEFQLNNIIGELK